MSSRKEFAWSYSSLKDFETCPRKWAEIRFYRNVKDTVSEAGQWGFDVHEQLAKLLKAKGEVEVPASLKSVEHIVHKLRGLHYRLRFVEERWAFDREGNLLKDFFDKNTWFRVVIDAGYVLENCKDAVIVDWKTGKPKEDDTQLKIFAKAMFLAVPYKLERVHAGFAWLQTGKLDHQRVFTQEEIDKWWEHELLPRVSALQEAVLMEEFEPRPSGLCRKWCPVGPDRCEFSGG